MLRLHLVEAVCERSLNYQRVKMRTNGWQSIVTISLPLKTAAAHVDLVVDFYNHINLLYGSITEFCSPQSCPEMKATDEYV